MKEFLKKFAAIVLMFIWVFSGYPGTFFNKIQPVYAATNDSTVEVLGGGGGGGVVSGQAGGGGGGGEYHRCTETLSVQSYTVTVGAGGSADANPNVETDSIFSGTGISVTADGGGGTGSATAGTAGTGGTVTGCDVGPTTFAGGGAGGGITADYGGGAGGGAGYGGIGGNGVVAVSGRGGGGGGGGGESGAGQNASAATGGTAGVGGGGTGGNAGTGDVNGSKGTDGVPATYHIVGGGGGGGSGGAGARVGGACSLPGGGSGGGEGAGAGAGCRGEVRIIYVDSEIAATGGTETTSGIYRIHTFTTSGTFQVTSVTVSVTPPTVQTNAEGTVTVSTAVLNGNITNDGGETGAGTEYGFAWGTSLTLSGSDTSTTTLGNYSATGAFSQTIFTLRAGITYYFRAYATNSAGTGFGAIDNGFTTGTDTSVTRRIRLFDKVRIKFIEGRIKLIGQ